MDYAAEWECEEEERVGHGEGLNGEGRSRVVSRSWIWVGRALKWLLYCFLFFSPSLFSTFPRWQGEAAGAPAKALLMFFIFYFSIPPLEVKQRSRKINSDFGFGSG